MKTWTFNVAVAPCGLSIRPQTLWPCGSLERRTPVCVRVCTCVCVTAHRWCLKDKCDLDCVSFFISQWEQGLIFPMDVQNPSAVSCNTHSSTHTHAVYTPANKRIRNAAQHPTITLSNSFEQCHLTLTLPIQNKGFSLCQKLNSLELSRHGLHFTKYNKMAPVSGIHCWLIHTISIHPSFINRSLIL